MLSELVASQARQVANTTITRRQNALALFQAYAEKALAAGTPPKGLEQTFAATLQISPSMWSQIKSARPIGDKLALRSSEEIINREMMLQGVMSIQAGDNPRVTLDKMMAFIPLPTREKMKAAA